MKHTDEVKQCNAIVLKKETLPYQDLASGKGIPVSKPIYEVVFKTDDEEILFTLSNFEYDVLTEGDCGLLKYYKRKYCNEIICFSDKIIEL